MDWKTERKLLLRKIDSMHHEVEVAWDRCINAEAKAKRLQSCDEFKLVAFLSRADIHMRTTVSGDWGYNVEVYHEDWMFEGRANNVISAARVAMLMEQDYLAKAAREK